MPALAIGGTTIPLSEAQEEEPLEVGSVVTSFDGSAASSVRARKRRWTCTTTELDTSAHTTVRGLLEGTPPLSCTGDLTGSVSCLAKVLGTEPIYDGAVLMRKISFRLIER